MDRNIVITGDDFRHIPCGTTSVCSCSNERTQCTMGLHTMLNGNQTTNGGTYRVQYVRVEKCGQRGITGRYCMHMHLMKECPNCLVKGNAIEFSQQRGIVVHGTHLALVEQNTVHDVRGVGIYIEDGNELGNNINYNAVVCPNSHNGPKQGCTVPGTDNGEGDTAINHAAFWSLSHGNNFLGNHAGNNFNGIFYHPSFAPDGRGAAQNKVCTSNTPVGRFEGNVLHANGRFGTYFVASSWPRRVTQSLATNGWATDCGPFDANGDDRGFPVAMINNVDYHNAFVGSYASADIQYQQHTSIACLNLMYHKETKNFADGCSAHFKKFTFEGPGTLSLANGPATILFEDCTFRGERLHIHMNHHCDLADEGGSGGVCNAQYMLIRPKWDIQNDGDWVDFGGDVGTGTHGAMLVLSPEDAANPNGVVFPAGFQGVCDGFHSWLLALDNGQTCVNSSSLGTQAYKRWHNGILCKKPLRRLNIYTFGVDITTAGYLQIDAYQSGNFVSRGKMMFSRTTFQDNRFRGYVAVVVAGAEYEYRIAFPNGTGIPQDWIIDFSDPVIGNRWAPDVIKLVVAGRTCPEFTNSQHDRRWILGSMDSREFLQRTGRGACTANPDMPSVNCAAQAPLGLPNCPAQCNRTCTNGYCDCYSGTCRCNAGFYGDNCQFDICSTARCGSHGKCKARYLGGLVPVAENACVCDEGWSGPTCEANPCAGETCNNRGTCRAYSEGESYCKCNPGYYGKRCEKTCIGVCASGGGTYPFGCNLGIPGTSAWCDNSCGYYPNGVIAPSPKCCINGPLNDCDICGTNPCAPPDNDCKLKGFCVNATCGTPTNKPDGSICQSALYGTCQGGVCTAGAIPSGTPPFGYGTPFFLASPTPTAPRPAPTTGGGNNNGNSPSQSGNINSAGTVGGSLLLVFVLALAQLL